jgi:hypothetical protein
MQAPDEGEVQERVREASWIGGEAERHEQGLVLPPTKPPVKMARFTIPAGTRCTVIKLGASYGRQHVTTKELGFERFERYRNGCYTFREQGFHVVVWRGDVKHREDALKGWAGQ